MIGDEDFNNFMKWIRIILAIMVQMLKIKIIIIIIKKKILIYIIKKNYKNNDNLKEIKEVNKEDESFGNEPPIPLDSEE